MKCAWAMPALRVVSWFVIIVANPALTFVIPTTESLAGLDLPTTYQAGLSFQAPNDFKVLTQNIFTVLGAPGINERVDLIAASDYIRGYDVVILNELFNDSASAELMQALRSEYPYQTPVVGRNEFNQSDCVDNDCWNSTEGQFHHNRPEDGGVALLSRWPIQERQQYVFSAGCDVDALANKGFAYIRIAVGDKIVHIVGTHLQADPGNLGDLGELIRQMFPCPDLEEMPQNLDCPSQSQSAYETVRLAQLREINAWIAQKSIPKEQMVIIGGDLNVDKEDNPSEYERMRCELNVDEPVWGGSPGIIRPWYTYDSRVNGLLTAGEPSLYVDYIFVRRDHAKPAQWYNYVIYIRSFPNNWSNGSAQGYEFSDHFPVAAYFDPANAP